jgi:hypothetical protein
VNAPDDVHSRLADNAREVLQANWVGRYTVPSRRLYPHQWSWDSAFIALGLCHLDAARAEQELESLLSAQWADGRRHAGPGTGAGGPRRGVLDAPRRGP